MTALAVVDVVNPAKGLTAGQDLWREYRRPESADGVAPSRDHPRKRFWMVGAGIPPQVSHRNQNALANSPGLQALSGYQIIQRTLADREQLRGIPPAQQQLLFSANWRLLVSIWLRTQR
jgi:hypothetical protein